MSFKEVETLIFLATGTGITPVKSILENIAFSADKTFPRIYVYCGNRDKNDFIWDPNNLGLPLSYSSVLSREKGSGMESGYIPDILLINQIELERAAVYEYGSELMILGAQKKLIYNR